jgi:hypothetical protein
MSEGCSKTNRPRAVICRWNGLSENKTFTATCCESLAFRKNSSHEGRRCNDHIGITCCRLPMDQSFSCRRRDLAFWIGPKASILITVGSSIPQASPHTLACPLDPCHFPFSKTPLIQTTPELSKLSSGLLSRSGNSSLARSLIMVAGQNGHFGLQES